MTKENIKDFIQWDVRSWSKALCFWEENIAWDTIQNGLELGSRNGGLSLWLALKGKSVVCSDLMDAKTMAEPLHKKHSVTSLIRYEDIDASNIPYENYFDVVVFKSIVCGIGKNDNCAIQQKVFDEAYKALKPGGKLLFAENLVASPLHRFLRRKFVNWGNACRYVSKDEVKGFLKDFSSLDIKVTGVLGTFGRNEKQRDFLAKMDNLFFNKICPNSWKYMCYGIAVK